MKKNIFETIKIDYIEVYAPCAKPLVYWHRNALGFSIDAYAGADTGKPGTASYLLSSGQVKLLLTSTYPVSSQPGQGEVLSFVGAHSCGVKRIALQVDDVDEAFAVSVGNGAMPARFPATLEDELGYIREAAIKLFDDCEIVFIDRSRYAGTFRPGFKPLYLQVAPEDQYFKAIDHIASELRINETSYWTDYISRALGTRLIQKIDRGEQNQTGMILNISALIDKEVTWVMTEPEKHHPSSRVQQSLEKFGAGFHHVAFQTEDIMATIKELKEKEVEFVEFPASYYELLRKSGEYRDSGIDIDALEEQGILVDKEDDTYLFQKFVKPMGDRPYFFYEIVQRVNGYNGFAVNNIVALRRAEDVQITQVAVE